MSAIDRTIGKISVERIYTPINSSINSKDFDIKFVIINPSENILILN